MTAGLAVFCRIVLVPGMLRTNVGCADQSRATAPATCGPAIEVPFMAPKLVSLVRVDDRTLTPGAERLGFSDPLKAEGPRLLKLARVLVMLMAPTEKEAL